MGSYLQVARVPDECSVMGVVKGILHDFTNDDEVKVLVWLQWTRFPEVTSSWASKVKWRAPALDRSERGCRSRHFTLRH